MQAKNQVQSITELFGAAMSMAGMKYFKEALMVHGLIISLYKQLGIYELQEVWPKFWIHCVNETIGPAKKSLGEELSGQYEEEGVSMGFDEAVKYVLEFKLD